MTRSLNETTPVLGDEEDDVVVVDVVDTVLVVDGLRCCCALLLLLLLRLDFFVDEEEGEATSCWGAVVAEADATTFLEDDLLFLSAVSQNLDVNDDGTTEVVEVVVTTLLVDSFA